MYVPYKDTATRMQNQVLFEIILLKINTIIICIFGKENCKYPLKRCKRIKNGKSALSARHSAKGKNFGVFRGFLRKTHIISRTAFRKRANDVIFPAGLRPAMVCGCVTCATNPCTPSGCDSWVSEKRLGVGISAHPLWSDKLCAQIG